MLGKELKEFKLILDCYIKLYAAFTKILNVVEIEKTLATLKSNLEEVENEFKHLKENQKASFKDYSLSLKRREEKLKLMR
ncbi:hypothetical protein [Candidatus Mesenet endosymbiont of Agriotes lineatus]|uniref:hypothetical protein n=1 Tax=Candidatus Mesenet endosymbiont of Agriotes lineatus TaxID=3077948 RepID=UPI0030CBD6DE